MWQPGSIAARSSSGSGGLARALLVLGRWAALITFLGFVSVTAMSSTHLQSMRSANEDQLVASTAPSSAQEKASGDLHNHHLRFEDGTYSGGHGTVGLDAADSGRMNGGGGRIVDRLRRHWEEFQLFKERQHSSSTLSSRRSGLLKEEHQELEPLRLELTHRDAPGSPLRREFASRAEEVAELLARDASRLAGLGGEEESSLHTRRLTEVGTYKSKTPTSSNFKAPIFSGSPLGTGSYLVDFYLGTPPQKFSLIADTGSDLVWTQCFPCASCYPQVHPLYNPANSSSFAPIACDSQQCQLIPAPDPLPPCLPAAPGPCFYRYQYGGATSFTEGIFGTETATMKAVLGSAVKIKGVAFGCGNVANLGSFGKADGILGLGQGPLSFPQQIRSKYGSKFAYCLLPFSKPTTTTSLLVFGEQSDGLLASKASVPGSHIQYTQLLSNLFSPTFYYVRPVKASVGGKVLPIKTRLWQFDAKGNGGSVFESGVTLTYLVTGIYKQVYSAFAAAVPYPRAPAFDATLTLCFNVNGVKKLNFPLLKIWFKDGAVYEPPADNIFVNVGGGISCLAIGEVLSPIGPNIFGNLLQQNFFIVYDPESRRLGFTPSECSF